MLFFALSGLINAISAGVLGFFIYFKNRKKYLNQIFGLMCLVIAVWSVFYFVWLMAKTKESALFRFRILMTGSIFIPVTYLHFVFVLLNLHEKRRLFLILSYIPAFIFLGLNFTPLFVKDVVPKLYFPYWPRPGIFFHPFLLMFLSYVGYGLFLLFKACQRTTGIKQAQIKYVLFASLIGFPSGVTNYFLWYGIPTPPYWNGLIALFPIIITYAILKHYLFEIKVILTELLVGVMGVILLILPFLMPTKTLKILTSGIFLLFCVFGYFLVKGMYNEIRNKERAEKFRIASNELKTKLAPTLDLEEVTSYIVDTLMRTFPIDKISFAIKQPTGEFYELWNNIGFERKEIFPFITETILCPYIKMEREPIIKEKLPLLIENTKIVSEKDGLKVILEKMKESKIDILYPLFQKKMLVGIIFLGQKTSNEPYSEEDIELLESLSYQISISINNTLLFRELMKDKEMFEKFYKKTLERGLRIEKLKRKIKELEGKLRKKEE